LFLCIVLDLDQGQDPDGKKWAKRLNPDPFKMSEDPKHCFFLSQNCLVGLRLSTNVADPEVWDRIRILFLINDHISTFLLCVKAIPNLKKSPLFNFLANEYTF
jgi:hypothetical protein